MDGSGGRSYETLTDQSSGGASVEGLVACDRLKLIADNHLPSALELATARLWPWPQESIWKFKAVKLPLALHVNESMPDSVIAEKWAEQIVEHLIELATEKHSAIVEYHPDRNAQLAAKLSALTAYPSGGAGATTSSPAETSESEFYDHIFEASSQLSALFSRLLEQGQLWRVLSELTDTEKLDLWDQWRCAGEDIGVQGFAESVPDERRVIESENAQEEGIELLTLCPSSSSRKGSAKVVWSEDPKTVDAETLPVDQLHALFPIVCSIGTALSELLHHQFPSLVRITEQSEHYKLWQKKWPKIPEWQDPAALADFLAESAVGLINILNPSIEDIWPLSSDMQKRLKALLPPLSWVDEARLLQRLQQGGSVKNSSSKPAQSMAYTPRQLQLLTDLTDGLECHLRTHFTGAVLPKPSQALKPVMDPFIEAVSEKTQRKAMLGELRVTMLGALLFRAKKWQGSSLPGALIDHILNRWESLCISGDINLMLRKKPQCDAEAQAIYAVVQLSLALLQKQDKFRQPSQSTAIPDELYDRAPVSEAAILSSTHLKNAKSVNGADSLAPNIENVDAHCFSDLDHNKADIPTALQKSVPKQKHTSVSDKKEEPPTANNENSQEIATSEKQVSIQGGELKPGQSTNVGKPYPKAVSANIEHPAEVSSNEIEQAFSTGQIENAETNGFSDSYFSSKAGVLEDTPSSSPKLHQKPSQYRAALVGEVTGVEKGGEELLPVQKNDQVQNADIDGILPYAEAADALAVDMINGASHNEANKKTSQPRMRESQQNLAINDYVEGAHVSDRFEGDSDKSDIRSGSPAGSEKGGRSNLDDTEQNPRVSSVGPVSVAINSSLDDPAFASQRLVSNNRDPRVHLIEQAFPDQLVPAKALLGKSTKQIQAPLPRNSLSFDPHLGVWLVLRTFLDMQPAWFAAQLGFDSEKSAHLMQLCIAHWLGLNVCEELSLSLQFMTLGEEEASDDDCLLNSCQVSATLCQMLRDKWLISGELQLVRIEDENTNQLIRGGNVSSGFWPFASRDNRDLEWQSHWCGSNNDQPRLLDVTEPIAALENTKLNQLSCDAPDHTVAVALLADAVLAMWARWIPGLRGSSPLFLFEKVIDRTGVWTVTDDAISIVLDSAPYDPALEIAGYFDPIERVPWLGGRQVRFTRR